MVSNIVFAVQRFPGYGGAEEYVVQLSSRLAEQGISCTILTSNLDERPIYTNSPNIKIIRFPVELRFGEYAIWKGLTKYLVRVNAELIHVNTYGYFHTDVISLLRRFKKTKLVFTSHGFHGLDAYLKGAVNISKPQAFRNIARPFYDYTLGFNEIKSADALVALSEDDLFFYYWAGVSQKKIHKIPLGIKDVFFELSNKDKPEEYLDGNPIILSIGELSWVKRKDIPIQALALLVKDYPQAKLVFVGKDGGQYSYLRSLVAQLGLTNNVHFTGFVPFDNLVNYYRLSDVLVHTSSAEGLSTTILEALALGLPVISTPAGGNGFLLKKSDAGIVIPFDDPQSLYVSVKRILNDPQLHNHFSKNGKSYTSKYHRWSFLVKQYLDIYQSLT